MCAISAHVQRPPAVSPAGLCRFSSPPTLLGSVTATSDMGLPLVPLLFGHFGQIALLLLAGALLCKLISLLSRGLTLLLRWMMRGPSGRLELQLSGAPVTPGQDPRVADFAQDTRALIASLEHATAVSSRWHDAGRYPRLMQWLAGGRPEDYAPSIGITAEIWGWLIGAEKLAASDEPGTEALARIAAETRDALLSEGPEAPRLTQILTLALHADDSLRATSSTPYRDRHASLPERPPTAASISNETGEDDPPASDEREALLQKHAALMRSIARSYTKDPASCDDLLQEIRIAVWQALDRFQARASVRTYIHRIAHYRGARFARRQPTFVPLGDQPDAKPGGGALDTWPERASLDQAVRELPDHQRRAISLQLLGFSRQEIAERLGITARTASARVSRARQMLRTRFAGLS
ncbi:MAG: sigma-70 family RNA polymerase sigma factor [Myxococcales bacterium FL481]|nr:MAG: sigma-70 family RNA polymerase sigma factor [Myxococcales bacterium FL481]